MKNKYIRGEEENIIYKIELLKLIESQYDIEIKDEEVEDIVLFEDLLNIIRLKNKNVLKQNKGRF